MSTNQWNSAMSIVDAALTFGINPSLEPIKRICELLGRPQDSPLCIQVAGTNGKSSTSRYLAALLQASGKKVALYTSPELTAITDRIEINGTAISEEVFAETLIRVHECAVAHDLELTEFELITATALLIFSEQNVEYAVLEVGLGGRWDATSVVHPKLVVLTGVDLEHTAVLGNTLAEIADEKAAVIKQGSIVVVAPTKPEVRAVFEQHAQEQQAIWVEVEQAENEDGSYQAQNKLTALTALKSLLGQTALSDAAAFEVMQNTSIPGRLETLCTNPLLIIDAAHNPASAKLLADTLDLKEMTLLLGILDDKDAEGIIEALVPKVKAIAVTQTSSPRAITVEELAARVTAHTGRVPQCFETPKKALDILLTGAEPLIATGSITLAGEVKKAYLARQQ